MHVNHLRISLPFRRMADLPAVVASGVVSGSAYALFALGILIIFRSTDRVNLPGEKPDYVSLIRHADRERQDW